VYANGSNAVWWMLLVRTPKSSSPSSKLTHRTQRHRPPSPDPTPCSMYLPHTTSFQACAVSSAPSSTLPPMPSSRTGRATIQRGGVRGLGGTPTTSPRGPMERMAPAWFRVCTSRAIRLALAVAARSARRELSPATAKGTAQGEPPPKAPEPSSPPPRRAAIHFSSSVTFAALARRVGSTCVRGKPCQARGERLRPLGM
jgi:hypothetical protein